MGKQALLAVATAALLVTAGCAAVTGSSDDASGDYPSASDVDGSMYDANAAALANESFMLTIANEQAEYDPSLQAPREGPIDVSFYGTRTVYADPVAGQYLVESSGTWPWLGQVDNGSVWTNETVRVTRDVDENGTVTAEEPYGVFDTSGGDSLWAGWERLYFTSRFAVVSENVSYERVGTETVDGDSVARYEADGVAALDSSVRYEEHENAAIDRFSATVLVDTEGVIRHLEYALDYHVKNQTVNRSVSATVTDVGETTVERPEWATTDSA